METLCYFYHPDHPDHLGSTSWVTDSAKNGVQYCEYLPFGEPLVDQRSTTWSSRYTFSGKERDSETGYSYFGARYYNSDLSIWLSVDPMAEERPSLSPYSYCQNSPIVCIDPTGALDDNYTVDDQGNTQLVEKTNDNFDVLYTKKSWDNGTKDKSKKIDKGVLSSKKTLSITDAKTGDKYNLDRYKIIGDDKAKSLFEFVEKNTKVEWGLTGIGTKNTNMLTTIHDEDSEAGGPFFLANSYTIRYYDHSHPFHVYPSDADISFAENLNLKFPKAKLQILHKENYYEYDKLGLLTQ